MGRVPIPLNARCFEMWTTRSAMRWHGGLVCALTAIVLGGCQGGGAPGGDAAPAATAAPAAADVSAARGEYLVTTGACNDCHTPWTMGPQGPEPDMTRMLSGHPADAVVAPAALPEGWLMLSSATNTAFLGPWGISFAANLTPHETGLGNVTEEMFLQAMRTGQHYGSGRPILPPMPAPWYSKLSDADLKAIYAYLRTIPAVENVVPAPVPPAGAPAQ